MVNTINNIKDGPGLFAKGIAQTLSDNMQLCKFVDKADSSEFDGKNGFKAGDTIYTSIPPRYVPTQDNLDITSDIKDTVEEKAPLVLNKTETVGMKLDSIELATEAGVASALKRFGIPAAESIAQNIESRCFDIAKNATYNHATAATYSIAEVLGGRTKLGRDLTPMKDRMLFLNSEGSANAVAARSGLFQSSDKIKEQYEDGYVGRADGYDWVETELVSTHTNGADVAGAVNDASVAEGASTLTVDGFTEAPTEGSVFTIAGVNKVHPITKVDMGVLQQFVVGAGATTTSLPISPSLYAASGGLQNVTALPADDAAVTFVGAADLAAVQGMGIHKSAFKMVTVPLYAPSGVDLVATETVDGITVNIVRDFDIKTREVITRLDVLYGFDEVRPEWSTRYGAVA